jgi:hypothetical protein
LADLQYSVVREAFQQGFGRLMAIAYKSFTHTKDALWFPKDWAVSICFLGDGATSCILLAEIYAVFLQYACSELSQHSGVSLLARNQPILLYAGL